MTGNVNLSFTIDEFLKLNENEFRGEITKKHSGEHIELAGLQTGAWDKEYDDLHEVLTGFKGRIIFEYSIPSLSKAIDVVLLLNGKIFVIEYKAGEKEYKADYIKQVRCYALLLKYCHNLSNNNWIIPILVATNAPSLKKLDDYSEEDSIYNTVCTGSEHLRSVIETLDSEINCEKNQEWEDRWENGIYKASPNIIEAVRNVWRKNNVAGFTMGEADEQTRLSAEDYIKNVVIKETQERPEGERKSICFVTGVPGAGKTLVGLNLSVALQDYGASMLSGNGPLVSVLTAALKRDYKKYKKEKATLKDEISIDAIIRSAYGYKKEIFEKRLKYNVGLGTVDVKENAEEGSQHVIIFDEAQRAWTQKKMIKPGNARKKYWQEEKFPFSEPGLLLWDMNLRDWGVIVCLVGEGQEIHDGEAGICEWFEALRSNHELQKWHIYMAGGFSENSRNNDNGYTLEDYTKCFEAQDRLTICPHLFLKASTRAQRSNKVSTFVDELLACHVENAIELYHQINSNYHIFLTRDLNIAKSKIRARQLEVSPMNEELDDTRIGMLMSSNAERLRPYGYPQFGASKSDGKIASWFLDTSSYVNSSNFLEVALDEFCVQGLEVDLDIVMWDADFRYNSVMNDWDYFKFNGKYWSKVDHTKANYDIQQFYMKNAYRVLLTRARKEMIIFVPEGDINDATRLPEFYDGTYEYLKSLGIKEI